MPKIKLHQRVNGNWDPVIDITITDHPAYLKDGLVIDSVEEALKKIEAWVRKRIERYGSEAQELFDSSRRKHEN